MMTSDNVNVKQVQALVDLNSELIKYGQNLSNDIRSIQREIDATIEWINERERFWRRKVTECERNLQQAKREYALCIASISDDDETYHDCSSEAANISQCEKELSAAKSQLEVVHRWKSTVNSKVSEFMVHLKRVREINNSTISQSSSFLKNKIKELDRYNSISIPSPSSLPRIGKHGYSYTKAKQEMLLRALDDPSISREIKGWIRNERRRVSRGEANSMRMPPGYDAGHRIPGVDTAANLRFEDIWINRSRYHRARKLGIEERYR